MHRLCGEDYCLCEETPRQSGTWLLFGLEFRFGATKFFVTYEITFFEAGFEDPGHQGHETQAVQREHALPQILEVQGNDPCPRCPEDKRAGHAYEMNGGYAHTSQCRHCIYDNTAQGRMPARFLRNRRKRLRFESRNAPVSICALSGKWPCSHKNSPDILKSGE